MRPSIQQGLNKQRKWVVEEESLKAKNTSLALIFLTNFFPFRFFFCDSTNSKLTWKKLKRWLRGMKYFFSFRRCYVGGWIIENTFFYSTFKHSNIQTLKMKKTKKYIYSEKDLSITICLFVEISFVYLHSASFHQFYIFFCYLERNV